MQIHQSAEDYLETMPRKAQLPPPHCAIIQVILSILCKKVKLLSAKCTQAVKNCSKRFLFWSICSLSEGGLDKSCGTLL